jgi:methyl-accepting chemotaxis protein
MRLFCVDEAFGPFEANISIQRVARISVMTAAIVAAVASAVEEQSAATREISSSVQQASAGTSDVAQNIHEITTAAGETGNAAGQVLRDASEPSRHSETLNAEVERFLEAIRKVV